MPIEKLHKVKLDPKSRKYVTNKTFPGLSGALMWLAEDAIDAASDYGLMASKSLVPIDTFELRGLNLKDGMIRKTLGPNKLSAEIFVTNDPHTGRGTTQAASKLARTLNSGINEQGKTMHRSQNSAAIQNIVSLMKGSPTKGWITKSDYVMITGVQGYIHRTIGGNTYG